MAKRDDDRHLSWQAPSVWIPPGYEALSDRVRRLGTELFSEQWTGREERAYDMMINAGTTVKVEHIIGLLGSLELADKAASRWTRLLYEARDLLATSQWSALVLCDEGLISIPADCWYHDKWAMSALDHKATPASTRVPNGLIVLRTAGGQEEAADAPPTLSTGDGAKKRTGRSHGWDWDAIIARAAIHYAQSNGKMQPKELIQYMRQLGQQQNDRLPSESTPRTYADKILEAWKAEQSTRK